MPDARPDIAPAYRNAGVDLAASDRIKRGLGAMVRETFDDAVVGDLGGFGGGYAIDLTTAGRAVLVASADGVGTKVLVAQNAGRHDTVGEDLVNHCVDDLLAARARPLFFLDYIAAGRLDEGITLALIAGFCRGCRANELPLLGGETAEMPDLYPSGRYDLAGFAVGLSVAPLTASTPAAGDVILGLASTGLHTNGYTLARRIVEDSGFSLDDDVPWGGMSWADALLAVHRTYRPAVGPLLDDPGLKAVAHITGGGFAGNLPRVLPAGHGAVIERARWDPPPLFEFLQTAGSIDDDEMYRVFNMGIGMCLVVAPESVDAFDRACRDAGDEVFVIGTIGRGEGVRWE